MKPADAQFSGYRAKILLKLGFRAPNLEPPLSSTLQIICCKQFFQRSNFSVSAPMQAVDARLSSYLAKIPLNGGLTVRN